MFKSHLDAPHHATHALLAGHPGMGAATDVTDPSFATSDTGTMITDTVMPASSAVAAPVPAATSIVFAGMTSKQLMIAGGIALVVFVLLKTFVKK